MPREQQQEISMEAKLFDLISDRLGLDPANVLSIRLNARRVVVIARDSSLGLYSKTFVDLGGQLRPLPAATEARSHGRDQDQ
jgi:hypothetical protein